MTRSGTRKTRFVGVALVLLLASYGTWAVRRQTLAGDATDGVRRVTLQLNTDCGGVGIVQLFKDLPAGATPPFAAGTWNGKVTEGDFMILAYPRNILNQGSPIARMCAYYIDPRDHALMRIEAKFNGAAGGVAITDDLMTALNVALNRGADTSFTAERVCYAYPSAVPAGESRATPVARPLFSAHGAGTLSVNGAVAILPGNGAATAPLNHTLNVHN